VSRKQRSGLPASIWALGFVSLFMDISSEMIHALLPVFLVTTLGASALSVGLIEGVGEATAAVTKLFSGWISDRIGNRKLLTIVGYGLGALSKPLFAIAPTASWVLLARFTDRVGKGTRGAPRDALVGDLAPARMTARAYGLRQSLDTVGAFTGPLLAIGLMAAWHDDFRRVFWFALLPGFVAVAILIFAVHEPKRADPSTARPAPIRWQDLRAFGTAFWTVVAVGAVLTLARFSEAFLILRARDEGLALSLAPIVLVVMNVVYALSAYPMGVVADKADKRLLLCAGFLVLIAADAVLALSTSLATAFAGIGLWGLHMGMTQGLLVALVAETAPASVRGTAFGVFHLVSGVALLTASLIAGGLWSWVGPSATFLAGAGFTAIGLAGGAAAALAVRRGAPG